MDIETTIIRTDAADLAALPIPLTRSACLLLPIRPIVVDGSAAPTDVIRASLPCLCTLVAAKGEIGLRNLVRLLFDNSATGRADDCYAPCSVLAVAPCIAERLIAAFEAMGFAVEDRTTIGALDGNTIYPPFSLTVTVTEVAIIFSQL